MHLQCDDSSMLQIVQTTCIYQHCGAQRGLWWYSHFKPAKCEQLVVLSLKHKFTHVAVITRLILARVWCMQLPSKKYVLLLVHFAKFFLKSLRGDEPAMICTGFLCDAHFTKGLLSIFLNQLFVTVTRPTRHEQSGFTRFSKECNLTGFFFIILIEKEIYMIYF